MNPARSVPRAPAASAASGLWFGALGPFEATWKGDPLLLGGAKQQMVLALLVLEANRVVSVDRLLEWVWHEDASPRSAGTLQVYMSNLRRLLNPASEQLARPLIVTQRPGYLLHLDPSESDLLTFDALCALADAAREAGRPVDAVAALREALDLWRGEPLSGLPVDLSDAGGVRQLELTRVTVTERIAELELTLGRHREILGELQTWVAEHPLDERLRGHLMLALYRCGRQADALGTYREGREQLLEDLGIDPSRELRELEGQILDQDPALDLAAGHDQQLEPPSTALRSSVLRQGAVLELEGTTVGLDRPVVTIGRLPDRHLVLDDADVSRVHAEVRRVGSGYRLLDSGSANGTVVNGHRVAEHELVDGDVIRVGGVELTFHTSDRV